MTILLSARFLAEVALRLRVPSVIGELAAGVLLGPSLLGFLEPTATIKLLAEIGIILLLFEVGLETDVAKLARTGVKPLVVAVGGFVMPFALGYGLSRYLFRMDALPALFIGGTLTATSIGITVRLLGDLKRQQSTEAQIVLGAAVLDDILGVVLLALLYEFSVGGGVSLINTGRVLLFIAIFLVLAPIAAKAISRTIKRLDAVSEIPGLLPTTMVSLILFFAWLAHEVGAPELMGGFASGMAVSRYFVLPFSAGFQADDRFAHRVESQMKPIIHLFTPIFFVTVGLSLDLRAVDWGSGWIWMLSLALLVVAVAGKVGAGLLLTGERRLTRWAVGLAMVPRGEVGLIFAELGRVNGIFSPSVYAALILVIAFTTLLPPFLMRWFYGGPGRALSGSA